MERCFQLSMFCVYIFPAKVLHWFVVAREDFSLEDFGSSMFLSCSYLANTGVSVNIQKKNQGSRIKVTLNQTLKWKWAHQKCITHAGCCPFAWPCQINVDAFVLGLDFFPPQTLYHKTEGVATRWLNKHIDQLPITQIHLAPCCQHVSHLLISSPIFGECRLRGRGRTGGRGERKRMWLGEKVHGVCLILIIETIHPQ